MKDNLRHANHLIERYANTICKKLNLSIKTCKKEGGDFISLELKLIDGNLLHDRLRSEFINNTHIHLLSIDALGAMVEIKNGFYEVIGYDKTKRSKSIVIRNVDSGTLLWERPDNILKMLLVYPAN